jgi:hypothetical protein
MKRSGISSSSRPLSEYPGELIDEESLALSTNQTFLDIIERSRKEIRAGQTISLEEVERSLLEED